MPHLGLFVSDDFKGRSRHGILGDVMEELDAAVGAIMNTLEEVGVKENTIVIFASDNGPWIKFSNQSETKYGDTRLQVGYATPFRDGKGSTWEGGHRVPGIISWPAKIKGNRNEQTPVSTLDIVPTIFKIAGVPLPTNRTIDGRDITPLLMPRPNSDTLEEFISYIPIWIISLLPLDKELGNFMYVSVLKRKMIMVLPHHGKPHYCFRWSMI